MDARRFNLRTVGTPLPGCPQSFGWSSGHEKTRRFCGVFFKPFPRGKVAPKGSDEEFGRKPESLYNISDLL